MTFSPLVLLTSLATATGLGLAVGLLLVPPRRLRRRVEPYLNPRLTTLGQSPPTGAFRSIFGPIVKEIADWVGAKLDRSNGTESVVRLRQAGLFRGLSEEEMLSAYRIRQLRDLFTFGAAGAVAGWLIQAEPVGLLLLMTLGTIFGASRHRGAVDKSIERRRERMKIEIYTVNQLLAMRVRAGGGVVQAVRSTCERGSGHVISELNEALRLHRSGWRAADAFRRIAELSPEPFCSRTYRLLATAEERGADLGHALLSLSEDVRETRRESIKRSATKRRAAMLVPTIAILAPVLILFVAAPLPYLITSWQ